MPRLTTLKPRLQVAKVSRVVTLNPDSWRTKDMTSAQRGYDYRWQKARERFLYENPVCVMCEARGMTVQASVVDHRVPHRGDKTLFWDESNWQSLCKPCHDGEKKRQENQGL